MTAVFLGIPTAPRGVGHLRGDRSFPDAARDALRDGQLRANLGHATSTIRAKRAAVVGEVPDWEELRAAGKAIKAATMARLDEHLEELERQVTARGGTVHWARDATEANAIVTRLVQATGADEVVKVKSMATQEIGLNEALEAAGIAAHETDLAELIVQLGEDTPSHILVPAIHKNRAEIREIFLRTMPQFQGPGVDADLTDEPRRLAMAARAHLRERFLRARVAISGANFAVAETGTLAVVESEGNGRMCLTLPQTLITVMGIEKLLPTWRDLEVFLQLLPRSSTGERMNPYTSLWTGVHEADGPQEFHLVLLDNGRTAVLADEVGREALHCIRCSACLNVCPVYERTGGHAYGSVYPRPIRALLSPPLTRGEDNPPPPPPPSPRGARFHARPVALHIPPILVHPRAAHLGAPARGPPPAGGAGGGRGARHPGGGGFPGPGAGHARPRAGAAGAAGGRPRRVPRPREADTAGRAPAARLGVDPQPRPPHPAEEDLHPAMGRGARPMNAREEVLARIRTALGTDRPVVPEPARGYRPVEGRPPGDPGLLDLLDGRLVDYRAYVLRCEPGDIGATVAGALDTGLGAGWDPADVVVAPGLPPDWRPEGVTEDDGRPAVELASFAATVTGVAVAIAATGTLVLDGTPACGRRALSLLPDCLVCVVEAGQVVGIA